MILHTTSLLAAGLLNLASAPATPVNGAGPPPAVSQCRWETPPQIGPRAPLQAQRWTCATAHERQPGHYEYYWPFWASQRALPLVRIWVPDRR